MIALHGTHESVEVWLSLEGFNGVVIDSSLTMIFGNNDSIHQADIVGGKHRSFFFDPVFDVDELLRGEGAVQGNDLTFTQNRGQRGGDPKGVHVGGVKGEACSLLCCIKSPHLTTGSTTAVTVPAAKRCGHKRISGRT